MKQMMKRVRQWLSRLNCRLGGHTHYQEQGRSRTTLGMKGGTMTDDYTWAASRCLTCGKPLR